MLVVARHLHGVPLPMHLRLQYTVQVALISAACFVWGEPYLADLVRRSWQVGPVAEKACFPGGDFAQKKQIKNKGAEDIACSSRRDVVVRRLLIAPYCLPVRPQGPCREAPSACSHDYTVVMTTGGLPGP